MPDSFTTDQTEKIIQDVIKETIQDVILVCDISTNVRVEKQDIIINTEEFIDLEILNFILRNEYCVKKTLKRLFPGWNDINIIATKIYTVPGVGIKVDIVNNEYINSIKINIVSPAQEKGRSFIDLNIYIRTLSDNNNTFCCPDLAIEITKNDSGDAGNQCYQRLEKILNIINLYGIDCYKEMDKVILINITNTNKNKSMTWEISKRLCAVLDIKFIAKRSEGIEYNNEKYSNLKEMEAHINSTQIRRGVPNRIYVNEANKNVDISTNLIHSKKKLNSNMNDPNTGFAVAVIYAIMELEPEYNIRFINHNLKEKQLTSQEKFWHCIKAYSDKIKFQSDNDNNHNINWDRLISEPISEYCKVIDPRDKEKYASIHLHYYILNNWEHVKVLFHNHAGCEKSNIEDPFNDIYYKGGSKEGGIPDLITFEFGKTPVDKHILTVYEAETSKNYKKGLKQIQEDFPKWIEANFIKKFNLESNTIIKYCLCLSGNCNIENIKKDIPKDIDVVNYP